MTKAAAVYFTDDGEELASELCDALDIAVECEIDVNELRLPESASTLQSSTNCNYMLILVSKNFLLLLQKNALLETQLKDFCSAVGSRVVTVMDRVNGDALCDAPVWLTRLCTLRMEDFGDNRDSVAKAVYAFWTASAVDTLNADSLAPNALPRVPSFDPLVREEKEVSAELLRCPEVPHDPL